MLPYEVDEFLDVGPAASTAFPSFIDVPAADHWDPELEPCVQDHFEDFAGVDSLAAFLTSFLIFVAVQTIEHHSGRALFEFAGSTGYVKETTSHPRIGKTGEWEEDDEAATNDKMVNDSEEQDEDVEEVVA